MPLLTTVEQRKQKSKNWRYYCSTNLSSGDKKRFRKK